MPGLAVDIRDVSYAYGDRVALDHLNLRIERGEMFGLLGPNGGGKSTLFRLLSTLVPLQSGDVSVCGHDLRQAAAAIRRDIGVVFQTPSVDKKLTVAENVACAGSLFGLSGNALRTARDEVLAELGLSDRARDRAETLSGGMRRRVELAQALLHRPRLLVLDEPSTGLDPGARLDFWNYLRRQRDERGTTVVLTTHLLEEAEKADRIALLDRGRLVALDTPAALRASVGGDAVTIRATNAESMANRLRERWQLDARVVEGNVRFEATDAAQWLGRILAEFPGDVESITLGKPTLEDVFVARTGHRFWRDDAPAEVRR